MKFLNEFKQIPGLAILAKNRLSLTKDVISTHMIKTMLLPISNGDLLRGYYSYIACNRRKAVKIFPFPLFFS